MSIRTQVNVFVLFLAVLVTASLLLGDRGGKPAPAAPAHAADPELFYTAVGKHFQVDPQHVHRLVDGGLPPGQVVVVYYLAQQSLRQPAQVVAERRGGKSWRDIAMASGLEPESFYNPLARPRAPFVNVYALYHQQPRERWTWNRLPLGDADIENLVNLRFLAGLDGSSMPQLMRLRSEGYDFVNIHHFLLEGQKTAQLARSQGEARS